MAQTLYRESDESRELRQKVAAERKAMREFELCRKAGRRNATGGTSSSSGGEGRLILVSGKAKRNLA